MTQTRVHTRILAADIGGTSSRFGCFSKKDGALRMEGDPAILPTNEADSLTHLLDQVAGRDDRFQLSRADALSLAVPGAVRRGREVVMPNVRWTIPPDEAARVDARIDLALCNDFVAQALATRTSVMDGAVPVKPGNAEAGGVVAVVGAGTGLGHSALVFTAAGEPLPLASEMGNTPFPFVGQEEERFHAFLRERLGLPYAMGDHVVSGGGLALLHEHLTGERLAPPEVGARFDAHPDTPAWFARFYGRVCRVYALAVVATGGVVIAGGLATRLPVLVQHPAFTEEFCNVPTYRALLEAMPVQCNIHPLSGLWGAAMAGWQRHKEATCTSA